ncbi:N-methyl-L-tryptophan oxidase [Hyphococcus luteus]|uniref:N-methyl-L-tryptophan oxidase n=1 Tax=Hyphococcus luteus TaxID=2058213 RepID=A0A2S7JZP0_9PROT|nr:N-methyl-L-tryptophan oxidase [Marinicaulis flavus]PQA85710.1 N-methyl-L-tryptophan oxidase [Marinicaulis flavus]
MSGGPHCAVVGAGIMGAAAAYALARRGARVTLFEQFPFGHDRGSSHGATRLFRTAYFEHPDYVPLLKRAAMLWRELEEEAHETLFEMTGVFMAGRADSGLIAGTSLAAEQHGLHLHRLSRAEARKRFFWFALDDDMEAMIEPDAGFVYADRARAAYLKAASAHDAELHENSPVSGWTAKGGQIELEAGGERHCFDRLVLAPGAFAGEFVKLGRKFLQPLRKSLFWTSPGEDRFTLANGFLPYAIEEADGRFRYGFPAVDADGVKIGEHTGGAPVADPLDQAPDAAAEARRDMEAFLKRRIPGVSSTIIKEQSCLYAMSPDGHFIIDRHPESEHVVLAMGHSGHGFKFAPLIGEALADLALKGETMREFDFLKLARFDQA